MKKMMLNDRYGQTEAVIKKTKKQTRRLLKNQYSNLVGQIKYTKRGSNLTYVRADFDNGITEDCPYAIGEIVAVAQSYGSFTPQIDWDAVDRLAHTKGWANKMFVKADLMPYQIRILNVRAERLQNITEEDCLREGITQKEIKTKGASSIFSKSTYRNKGMIAGVMYYKQSAREVYATLIDKISGKGTWEANPYVWRIEFELVK